VSVREADFHLLAAGVHAVPALLWTAVAVPLWRDLAARRSRNPLLTVAAALATAMALHFGVHVAIELTPTRLEGRVPDLHVALGAVIDVCVVAMGALFGHMVLLLPVRHEAPGRTWLSINYGAAALAASVALLPVFFDGPGGEHPWLAPRVPAEIYLAIAMTLALWRMTRLARRGRWRPGGLGELRTTDVALAVFTALVSVAFALLVGLRLRVRLVVPADEWNAMVVLLVHTAFGLTFAAPFVARMLGDVLRVLLRVTAAGVTVALYLIVEGHAAAVASPELRRLAQGAALVGLALGLAPGQASLGHLIDRLVFRRSNSRRAQLLASLTWVSPEMGTAECCRRALAALVRVMQLRGAAILLTGDGEPVVHGAFAVAPLTRAWPRSPGTAGLPDQRCLGGELRELPPALREALVDADATGVLPIVSMRRRWGDLFITAGPLGASLSEEDARAAEAFVTQLGLVLDGTELVARALAVERSLAHAEKLAAVGELAARIAHEIRNPVTAARSLAQQLVREPDIRYGAELALILAELARVERQVAALLRFSRREEFRFETVDVAELARATVEHLRPRLEKAGISVALLANGPVPARADAEKLRQVLINVIENAIDALGGVVERRLSVAVARAEGQARIDITDSGPGLPPDTLARVFEPFFSTKETGTGLGLAIAKRTLDAHGGRITAAVAAGETTFNLELPLALGSPA
jgi:signal transduction histidine kinase